MVNGSSTDQVDGNTMELYDGNRVQSDTGDGTKIQGTRSVSAEQVPVPTKSNNTQYGSSELKEDASKISDKDRKNNLIATIKGCLKRGDICVVPPKNDGSKRPFPSEWKPFQNRLSTRGELEKWYSQGLTGVGYVCGAVSGNLEAMDFDVPEIYTEFREAAKQSGLGALLERIEQGYLENSQNGNHLLYRCTKIGRNSKLATRPKRPEETEHEKDTTKALIEIRGEGGFIIVAPSYGNVHPSGGEYAMVSGGPGTIVEITPEERDDLHALARTFHVPPENHANAESSQVAREAKAAGRPGDDFNSRADWIEVLNGWTVAYQKNGITNLRKPGKQSGVHGTINADSTDRFYCFTTATEFEQRFYDKFSAYAVLYHGGDFAAAAKDLAAKGYGNSMNAGKTVTSITDVTWEEPLMFGELRTPDIPPDLFPGVYGKFIDSVSKATQTPSGMAAMFMLSVMATSLQGKAVVAPKLGGYHEPVQLWTITALPPASRKTAVMDNGMTLEHAEERVKNANTKCFPVFERKELDFYLEIATR